MTIVQALYEAFNVSDYMHSVGSGDEQAMNLAVEVAKDVWENSTDEEAVAFLGGALAARALTSDLAVMELAQRAWEHIVATELDV